MKIVLLNPPPRRRVELYDRPNYPPLALAHLAGAALAAGLDTAVVDAKLDRLDLAQTVARVRALQPDVVGITAMTHEITRAGEVAAALKRELPGLATIVGGVHATFLAKETLAEFPGFDYAVAGEGEITLPRLLAALPDPSGVPGIAWRVGAEIRTTAPGEAPANLDELPLPAWHLWPRLPVYHLSTARG